MSAASSPPTTLYIRFVRPSFVSAVRQPLESCTHVFGEKTLEISVIYEVYRVIYIRIYVYIYVFLRYIAYDVRRKGTP